MFISDSDEVWESETVCESGSACVHGQFLLFLKHASFRKAEGTHCIRAMSEEDVVEPSNWVGVGVYASKSLLQDAAETGKSWVPSNLFTVTTSYETSSKPLYCLESLLRPL